MPLTTTARVIPEGRGYYGVTTLLSIPGGTPTGGNAQALVAARIYYFPIYIDTLVTIDRVVIEVTVAAGVGEKCRIAIYDADRNWQPVTQQVASAEIAIDGVAVVSTDIAATVLPAGRYLIALTLEGNATLRSAKNSRTFIGYIATLTANLLPDLVYVAAAYAALPASGTAWDTINATTTSQKHVVFLRVSIP